MKLVVKIGGAALADHELVSKFAKTIPDLCREGHKLVIVHGGGAALSRTLKQLVARRLSSTDFGSPTRRLATLP